MGGRAQVVVGLVAALSLVAAPVAGAKTYSPTRTDDPTPGACKLHDCSLREAVLAANQHAGADKVVLGSGNVYNLSIPGANEQAAASGDLDVTEDLTITSSGAKRAVVDAHGIDRVLEIIVPFMGPVVNLNVSGLTVRGGDSTADSSCGGGIGGAGDLRITRSKINGNTAIYDGGGVCGRGNTTITNSVIASNHVPTGGAYTAGGGVFAGGDLRMSHVTVSGNTVRDLGGGIAIVGAFGTTKASLDHVVVRGNSADQNAGGGLELEGGSGHTVTITDSTIAANKSAGHGGGVDNFLKTTITRSTLSRNAAAVGGGGIANSTNGSNSPGSLTLVNDTLARNRAKGFGGGIDNFDGGAVSLKNTTIAYNTADSENLGNETGGGLQTANEQSAVTHASNTIIIANRLGHAGTTEADCHGMLVSDDHNLVGPTGAGCDLTVPQPHDRRVADAKLGPLAGNGGPSQTVSLRSGSKAINHGGPTCAHSDQRGVPRSLGGVCDIGAYERVSCHGTLVDVVGTAAADHLAGRPGKDGILGLGGGDRLIGRSGNDGLCGGGGSDSLLGGSGSDFLDGGPGTDSCNGGSGVDQARSCEASSSIP